MFLMTSRQKYWAKRILLGVFSIYLFGWFVVQLMDQTIIWMDWWGHTYQVAAAIAAGAVLMLSRKLYILRNKAWKVYVVYGLGLLLQLVGQCMVFYLFAIDAEIFPSVADVFFLLSVTCYAVATVLLMKLRLIDLRLISKTCFVIVYILTLCFYTIILVAFSSDGITQAAIVLSYVYAIIECIFVTIIALLLQQQLFNNKDHINTDAGTGLLFLATGLLSHFMADTFFTFLYYENVWLLRAFPDILYLESFVFIGYGLLKIGDAIDKRRALNQ